MTHSEALAILQDAVQSPLGLLLHTSNPRATVQVLERVRASERRPEFASIVYKQVQFEDGNLVVMKALGGPEEALNGLPPELRGLNEL